MLNYISVFFLIFTSLAGVYFLAKSVLDLVFSNKPKEEKLSLSNCEERLEYILRSHLANGEVVTLFENGLSEEELKIAERMAARHQNILIIK